ncbi:hypothetical protein [Pseudoruegeria sp. SK021]|nr:hypothetical protein [Pseudoruegeria sp. SK021]
MQSTQYQLDEIAGLCANPVPTLRAVGPGMEMRFSTAHEVLDHDFVRVVD